VAPYFNAYSRNVADIYFRDDESVDIAEQLLYLQFGDDPDVITRLLTDMYEICVPKRNSMCVVSPPSAGKNYFFNAITSYFLNYGMFDTVNKTNNFAWGKELY